MFFHLNLPKNPMVSFLLFCFSLSFLEESPVSQSAAESPFRITRQKSHINKCTWEITDSQSRISYICLLSQSRVTEIKSLQCFHLDLFLTKKCKIIFILKRSWHFKCYLDPHLDLYIQPPVFLAARCLPFLVPLWINTAHWRRANTRSQSNFWLFSIPTLKWIIWLTITMV